VFLSVFGMKNNLKMKKKKIPLILSSDNIAIQKFGVLDGQHPVEKATGTRPKKRDLSLMPLTLTLI
jgi:hypothetical protein